MTASHKQIKTRFCIAEGKGFFIAMGIMALAFYIGNSVVQNHHSINIFGLQLYINPNVILHIGIVITFFFVSLSIISLIQFYISNIKFLYLVIDADRISWPTGLFLNKRNNILLNEVQEINCIRKNGRDLLVIKTISNHFTLSSKMMFRKSAYQEILHLIQDVVAGNNLSDPTP